MIYLVWFLLQICLGCQRGKAFVGLVWAEECRGF